MVYVFVILLTAVTKNLAKATSTRRVCSGSYLEGSFHHGVESLAARLWGAGHTAPSGSINRWALEPHSISPYSVQGPSLWVGVINKINRHSANINTQLMSSNWVIFSSRLKWITLSKHRREFSCKPVFSSLGCTCRRGPRVSVSSFKELPSYFLGDRSVLDSREQFSEGPISPRHHWLFVVFDLHFPSDSWWWASVSVLLGNSPLFTEMSIEILHWFSFDFLKLINSLYWEVETINIKSYLLLSGGGAHL